MPAVSLATMTTEVRRRGNFETNDQANAFATDAEIYAILNSYLDEFYDEILDAKGPAYFRDVPQVIQTVAGTSAYSLVGNFYKLISVDITWGLNIIRSARPFEEAERNRFKWVPGWNYDCDVYYQIQGGIQSTSIVAPKQIVFQPSPTSATQVTINYVPIRTQLLNGTDTIDSINGWTDFAIYSAIADLKEKDEADSGPARARAEVIRSRIRALADGLDLSEPPRVQNVKRRGWREL